MDVKKNIFVIGLDMENRSAEEIAKDAALQIAAITDRLKNKRQRQRVVKKSNRINCDRKEEGLYELS